LLPGRLTARCGPASHGTRRGDARGPGEGTSGHGIKDSRELAGQRVTVLRLDVFGDPAGGGVLAAETGQHHAEEERAPARITAHGFEHRAPGALGAVACPGGHGDQGSWQPVPGGTDYQLLGCLAKGGRTDCSRGHGSQHPGRCAPDHLMMTELTVMVGAGVHESCQCVLLVSGSAVLADLLVQCLQPVLDPLLRASGFLDAFIESAQLPVHLAELLVDLVEFLDQVG
jgi:hypothetical protein